MKHIYLRIEISFLLLSISALALLINHDSGAQNIIEGKIWSGSDTVKLGENKVPDSLASDAGDTSKALLAKKEIDWSSGKIIELPEMNISSKTKQLKLILSVPRMMKFIPEAPLELAAYSSDTAVVSIGQSESKNPEKPLIFPLTASPGKADIFLYYRVVNCTRGPGEACFFKEAKLKVPVTVGDYDEDVLEIHHEID